MRFSWNQNPLTIYEALIDADYFGNPVNEHRKAQSKD